MNQLLRKYNNFQNENEGDVSIHYTNTTNCVFEKWTVRFRCYAYLTFVTAIIASTLISIYLHFLHKTY